MADARTARNGTSAQRHMALTLSVYLAQRLLVYLIVTLLALAFFAYLIDVAEQLRQMGNKNVSSLVGLWMSFIKLPSLMLQILPFAVLMATMVTLQQLNRSSELIALRASGLPARRFLLGPMVVVLLAGLVAVFIVNPLSASLLRNYDRINTEVLGGRVRGTVLRGGSIWLKQQERGYNFFIYGRNIEPNGRVLNQATLFTFDDSDAFKLRMDARRMVLENGRWQLQDVTIMDTGQNIRREPTVTLPTSLTPDQVRQSFNQAEMLNVWELKQFIEVLKETGLPSNEHEMIYQRLLALPALLLAMFWLGVPFALRYVRQGGLALAVAAGLGMGFGFYLFGNYVAAFGLAGRLSIPLAAWIPTLIAALIATALLIQLREE